SVGGGSAILCLGFCAMGRGVGPSARTASGRAIASPSTTGSRKPRGSNAILRTAICAQSLQGDAHLCSSSSAECMLPTISTLRERRVNRQSLPTLRQGPSAACFLGPGERLETLRGQENIPGANLASGCNLRSAEGGDSRVTVLNRS